MRGHREKLVFSRVTGHPNIEEDSIWFDSHDCWICDKHNKLSISVSTVDKLVDQEFQDIIMLSAMMQYRSQKRKQNYKEEDNMEVLLEEKSRKSEESVVISDSSGSGPDIEGRGYLAYENQKKGKRAGMFKEMQEAGRHNSKEHFDEF